MKLPQGKRELTNKRVYKITIESNNSHLKYKPQLVVKGFSQKKDFDFQKIFSHVVKMSSIQEFLGVEVSLNLEIQRLDIKTSFLHGDSVAKV